MKKTTLLVLIVGLGICVNAQTVPIYIYFASHNESDDITYHGLNYSNSGDFATMITYVQTACDTLSYYNASYEMMLESNFILGALSNDNAYASSSDIIQWADNQNNIEVQSHNHYDPTGLPPNPYNSTDLVYLLDSCGVDTAEVLGGFIWTTFPGPVPQDWTQWQTPQPGAVFANAPNWQPSLIWGAGSPMHTNDYEGYGIWRPSAPTLGGFGTHDPMATLVNFGTGCGQEFVLDDTTDATLMAYRIMNFVDSLHAHYDGNANAFFNMKVMFNFRYLPEPGYLDKVGTVLSIINPYIIDGRMEYKGIMDIYQEWQTLHPSNNEYFISACDTTVIMTSVPPAELETAEAISTADLFSIFPNPSNGNFSIVFSDAANHTVSVMDMSGREFMSVSVINSENLDLTSLAKGMYLVSVDNTAVEKIILE